MPRGFMPVDPCLLILADFLAALAYRQSRIDGSEAPDFNLQLRCASHTAALVSNRLYDCKSAMTQD